MNDDEQLAYELREKYRLPEAADRFVALLAELAVLRAGAGRVPESWNECADWLDWFGSECVLDSAGRPTGWSAEMTRRWTAEGVGVAVRPGRWVVPMDRTDAAPIVRHLRPVSSPAACGPPGGGSAVDAARRPSHRRRDGAGVLPARMGRKVEVARCRLAVACLPRWHVGSGDRHGAGLQGRRVVSGAAAIFSVFYICGVLVAVAIYAMDGES